MKRRARLSVGCALVAGVLTSASAPAQIELIAKNDSLTAGDPVFICVCFVGGEEAAVWLTSPCDGNIVGFQIFWASQSGGAQPRLEEAIVVYNEGSFPTPGSLKDELLAPEMLDGGLNEFRFRDEQQTIPISIPVDNDETFVVSLSFFNDNAGVLGAPSVVSDDSGCQLGKNAVRAVGLGWVDACFLGVSGDWVIRAIIDCPEDPCPADMNGDGFVDNGDINLFIGFFLAGNLEADLNGDGFVDNGDISVFIQGFFAGC